MTMVNVYSVLSGNKNVNEALLYNETTRRSTAVSIRRRTPLTRSRSLLALLPVSPAFPVPSDMAARISPTKKEEGIKLTVL